MQSILEGKGRNSETGSSTQELRSRCRRNYSRHNSVRNKRLPSDIARTTALTITTGLTAGTLISNLGRIY
jgi:hypothetical protein